MLSVLEITFRGFTNPTGRDTAGDFTGHAVDCSAPLRLVGLCTRDKAAPMSTLLFRRQAVVIIRTVMRVANASTPIPLLSCVVYEFCDADSLNSPRNLGVYVDSLSNGTDQSSGSNGFARYDWWLLGRTGLVQCFFARRLRV